MDKQILFYLCPFESWSVEIRLGNVAVLGACSDEPWPAEIDGVRASETLSSPVKMRSCIQELDD